MTTTSSRLLELLSLLQGRRDWPGNDLAERLEVSVRTVRRDAERVRFGYRRRDGTTSRRDVEPHALVNHGRRWYLVAFDLSRSDWRTFRLDRLTGPASPGARFTPRRLPSKNAAAFVQQSIAGAPNRYEALVTLRAPAEEMSCRVPPYWGTIEPVDDRTCRYTTGDDDLRWLAMRIAMLDVDFEVHGPPELVEHLHAMGARLSRGADRRRRK